MGAWKCRRDNNNKCIVPIEVGKDYIFRSRTDGSRVHIKDISFATDGEPLAVVWYFVGQPSNTNTSDYDFFIMNCFGVDVAQEYYLWSPAQYDEWVNSKPAPKQELSTSKAPYIIAGIAILAVAIWALKK